MKGWKVFDKLLSSSLMSALLAEKSFLYFGYNQRSYGRCGVSTAAMLINRETAKVCVDESVLRSSHQSLAATVVTAQTTSLSYKGRAPSTFVHIINFLHSPKLTITTLIYIFNQQYTQNYIILFKWSLPHGKLTYLNNSSLEIVII